MINSFFKLTNHLLNTAGEAVGIKTYIDSRISKKIQDEYGFGYMPTNDQLHLLTDVFSIKFLEDNNIIYRKNISGAVSYINFFGNHNLIFPFYDSYNNFVSIVARTNLDNEKQKELKIGKYKYTVNYNKEKFVFGLNKSKKSIIEKDFVIVVEGQFDYFALISNGIENCVCLGCANMSSYQFFEINKYTNNIYLMYDNDDAGRVGMNKTKKIYEKHANVKLISPMAGYKDVDEFFKSDDANKERVIQLLKNGFK